MIERLWLGTGLIFAGVGLFFLVRKFHLRAVQQRHCEITQGAVPGLGAFEPGQPGVLFFSTADCVPCRTVLKPTLQRLVAELGNCIQVLEVDAQLEIEAVKHWKVVSVPTVFVLDPQGNPRHVHYGVVGPQVLRTQLADWL